MKADLRSVPKGAHAGLSAQGQASDNPLTATAAGKALYDPAGIHVAAFIVHAEWDAELPSYMLYEYFARLTNVLYKRYVQIGEGTHSIMMGKNRMQLFRAVQQFLDESFTPGQ